MKQVLSISQYRNRYDEGFRRDVHSLIAFGYQKARSIINSQREEPDITGFICKEVKEWLNLNIDSRFDRYFLDDEFYIEAEDRTGKRRRRIDIFIQCSRLSPRQNYYFEAKRLATSSYSIGEYLGKEGLQLFIDGIYAGDCPEVGMIGYVQKGSFKHWEKELCQKSPITTELLTKKKPEKIKIINDLEYEWVSEHDRQTQKPVTVYHIFLDCA